MQAIYIILFISAFTISVMSSLSQKGSVESGDATLNFLTYRDAVVVYAESHALTNGTIPSANLTLPVVLVSCFCLVKSSGRQCSLCLG